MQANAKRTILAILIALNCITIFYFSNQIADNSSKQSSRVVEFVAEIIPAIKNMQEPEKTTLKEEILTPIVRKSAHFSIYALLGILTINFANIFENQNNRRKIIYAILFCAFYAITDEFHQYFIPGRSAELRDVLIDSIGALTGIVITNFVKKYRKKVDKQRY